MFIKLKKSVFNIYASPQCIALFIYMLVNCFYQPVNIKINGSIYSFPAGTFICSQSHIKISIGTFKKMVDCLQDINVIQVLTARNFVISDQPDNYLTLASIKYLQSVVDPMCFILNKVYLINNLPSYLHIKINAGYKYVNEALAKRKESTIENVKNTKQLPPEITDNGASKYYPLYSQQFARLNGEIIEINPPGFDPNIRMTTDRYWKMDGKEASKHGFVTPLDYIYLKKLGKTVPFTDLEFNV